jgi:hypothetical protein
MLAAASNGVFGWLVTDAANQDILAPIGVLLQYQVRVVGNLSHLHNETKDVGIIVQKNSLRNIGIESALSVGHDTIG